MKILLTGATGFFGSRLTDYLLTRTDHSLVLLVRGGRGRGLPTHGRVKVFDSDLADPDSLKEAAAGCDAVIHAAALVSTWARDPSLFDRVNVEGALNMLTAAGEAGVGKIIYISSFMALGPSGSSPLTETGLTVHDTFYNDYERTKYRANLEACRLAESEGLPLTVLYPTVMYGPGPLTAGNLVVNLLVDYMKGRLPFRLGDGRPKWNYVFVEDVVRGTVLALEDKAPAGRYILGGENISMAAFFDTVEKVTGIRQPRFSLPFPAARLVGAAEEALARLTGRVPLTTRGVIDIYKKDWTYDSSRACETLGYTFLPLEEGLARTVAWVRKEVLKP